MRRIEYMSQREAEYRPACKKTAFISISDPGKNVYLQNGWLKVLKLKFEDYDPNKMRLLGFSNLMNRFTLFDKKHALKIKNFYQSLPKNVNLNIHCKAGVSRSAAIAKFLNEIEGNIIEPRNPNWYIIRVLKEIWN